MSLSYPFPIIISLRIGLCPDNDSVKCLCNMFHVVLGHYFKQVSLSLDGYGQLLQDEQPVTEILPEGRRYT